MEDDDITSQHSDILAMLQCNIIFCDICCSDRRVGGCRP